MPKGTLDHVGFLAPQSKQLLLASLRFSFSKSVCETVFGARAMVEGSVGGGRRGGDGMRGCRVELMGALVVKSWRRRKGCVHFDPEMRGGVGNGSRSSADQREATAWRERGVDA